MYPKRQWKARFTRSEFYRGWVFFVLYLLVFPLFTGWLQMILSQRFDFFPPGAGVQPHLLFSPSVRRPAALLELSAAEL